MALKMFSCAGVRKIFLTPCWGAWGMLSQKILNISVLRLAENAFVVKMLQSSSNRGNWCCLRRKFFWNLQLTWRFWWCTVRVGESVAYRESPGQRRRLGRSDCIEASRLNLLIFFLHFFATWESLFSQFLVKVRSCGHILVSAKPTT